MTAGSKNNTGSHATPSPKEGRVLITGISGGLGKLLARRLHRTECVHGIDTRPFKGKPKDVVVHNVDFRKKKVADLFRAGDIKAVFHLGAVFSPGLSAAESHEYNLTGTNRLLELCDRYNVPVVVILSSATTYGALPANHQYLTEDMPLLGGLRFPQIRALVEMDMLAQTFFWKHPHIRTIILRPSHIVGPTVRNALTYYMNLRRLPYLLGFNPQIQLVHEEDATQALELAYRHPDAKGVFNIAGAGALPVSTILDIIGHPTVPLLQPFAGMAMDALFKLGMTKIMAPEADYVKYVCMVDDSRARDILGYRPRYSLRDTIRDALYSI